MSGGEMFPRMGEECLNAYFPSERMRTWVWHVLGQEYKGARIGGPDSKKEIGDFLGGTPGAVDRVMSAANRGFVPDDEFRWVDDSQVQDLFLKNYIKNIHFVTRPDIYPGLSRRRRFVAFIDCASSHLEKKIAIVRLAREAWASHSRQLRVFNWFKGKGEAAKCDFAWSRFVRLGSAVTSGRAPFIKQEDVILAFEASPLGDSDKQILLMKLKRAWTQDQYRKKTKGKKQFNVNMPEEVIKLLGDVAKKRKMSKTQVLEDLIRKEGALWDNVKAVGGYKGGQF